MDVSGTKSEKNTFIFVNLKVPQKGGLGQS